jgi:PKD domain
VALTVGQVARAAATGTPSRARQTAGSGPAFTGADVIDGPSSKIVSLGGLSIARDGTGGLAYLKDNASGVAHVFVSALSAGAFEAPEQIDARLSGASSQPVIAAGIGGVLLIAFVNQDRVYVVQRGSSTAAYSNPHLVFQGAINPSLEMTNFGKAYLAFTAQRPGGGDNVRTAFYYLGKWRLEHAPLNAIPNDDAGTGNGAPKVAASGDGVAIVAWGEIGHVYTRRVWGTAPSVVDEQADVPSLSGSKEILAQSPAVASGGDSAFADVVFQEILADGQSRVLVRRLQGSQYNRSYRLNPTGVARADQPGVAVGEYGSGIATAAAEGTNQLFAERLGTHGQPGGLESIDSLTNAAVPDAVPAIAKLSEPLIVWQQDQGALGVPEIRLRLTDDTGGLGPPQAISSPFDGPSEAASGLAVGADLPGDVAAAWVQGTGSSTRIMAAKLALPPGEFDALSRAGYVRTVHPTLAWSTASELWGTVSYAVQLDGQTVGHTSDTSLTVAGSLSQGPHVWDVAATNPAGLTRSAQAAMVFVDTVPPSVSVTLSGAARVGAHDHISVEAADPAPGLPASDASGVAQITVDWGDGTTVQIKHGKFHIYRKPGHYVITVTVADRAGNITTVTRDWQVAAATKRT